MCLSDTMPSEVIAMFCTLDEDINKCPYFKKNEKRCIADAAQCAYQEREKDPILKEMGYTRPPRWYEKYYK